jgi:3-oxoacyl-[acyl-carrier protein] reductase
MNRDQPLKDKVAVITGAGRGIGRAIAMGYAAAGAAVSCAARSTTEIESVVAEIEQAGGRALAVTTDVTAWTEVVQLFEATVETFGGLDLLVINAGSNYDRRTVDQSRPEDWQATLDVNLFGAYYCAKASLPHFKARGGGHIITIGSGMGRQGRPASSAYACSKAGLWMLTRVLAQELWQDNISVNELIPGPVSTALTADLMKRPEGTVFGVESEWVKQPEEVVPLALFLAAQRSPGPTGQSYSLMRR